jgi:two-component system alkaline phosphatase synthesis response regulator PhoP
MKKRVLIFDDDKDILSICSFIIKAAGYEVMTEPSCHNLLEKVERARPDIIMMDNKIPNEGGISSTLLLKSSPGFCQIPVVFFSANSDVKALAAAANADLYIEKPFDADLLIGVVRQAAELAENHSGIDQPLLDKH